MVSTTSARRPRVGITCGYATVKNKDGSEWPRLQLDGRFCEVIYAAGGIPVLIPPTDHARALSEVLAGLDGLILTGGSDISPQRYGGRMRPEIKLLHPLREFTDFAAAASADERQVPVLAVCLGIQEWNVHRGGTLHPHLPDLKLEPRVEHCGGDTPVFHTVRVKEGSLLHRLVGRTDLRVYSSHHQGLDRLGHGLVATAWAEDGLIEAVEDPSRKFCLGVQWHPEDMPDDPLQRRLLAAVVEAAHD